jgi:hypothetical protein
MPVTALPDLAGAVNGRLRSSSAIVALVNSSGGWNGTGSGPRISTQRQGGDNGWKLPTGAVLIEAGRGGGEDAPGLQWERIDLLCYGADARTAHLLWRTVHPFFCPPVGLASGFRAVASGATVSVLKVAQEGGPLRLTDPDEAWPYSWASYRVVYAVDPIA